MLLAWNVYLTVNLSTFTNEETTSETNNSGTTIINQTVHNYTTELTEVVENTKTKIVTVIVTKEENETFLTGIIYSSNSSGVFIVTTAHDLMDSESVAVKFDNNIAIDANVLGMDEASDVAVLFVSPDFDSEAITIGDSDLIKEGEYVFSLTGRNDTANAGVVSFGVVSATVQMPVILETSPHIDDIVISDISSIELSDGAPLMNISGEVIGMISTKLSSDSSLLTTAISINEVKLITDEIINNNAVDRAYLGVIGRNVSDIENYEKGSFDLQLDIAEGILVTSVLEESPASGAGILVNDVITSADILGENNETVEISSVKDLRNFLYTRSPEETVYFNINRQGTNVTCIVVLQ